MTVSNESKWSGISVHFCAWRNSSRFRFLLFGRKKCLNFRNKMCFFLRAAWFWHIIYSCRWLFGLDKQTWFRLSSFSEVFNSMKLFFFFFGSSYDASNGIVFNSKTVAHKVIVHPKMKFCHHLLKPVWLSFFRGLFWTSTATSHCIVSLHEQQQCEHYSKWPFVFHWRKSFGDL